MSLIEKITDKELRMIGSYIDSYALGGCDRIASVEHILREWDRAKSENLAKIFGDELILSKEISFSADETILEHNMMEMLKHNDQSHGFMYFWNKAFQPILWDLAHQKDSLFGEWRGHVTSLCYADNLTSNRYDGPTFDLMIPQWKKPIKIQTGAKITRLLGKIAKNMGWATEFEEFRIAHSQVLNQRSFHGTMCLSIHPLDYMTMSDNQSGWSSCMSWQNDGCYRQGTVEMMNSACVVVAYLRGNEDMSMPGGFNYVWNNKKWRELFIVHPRMISNVKGYPYVNDTLSQIALNWLRELCGDSYSNEMTTYLPWSHFEVGDKKYLIDPQTNLMYNDFSEERWQFAYLGNLDKVTCYNDRGYSSIYVDYSGSSECMCCGDLGGYFETEGYLVCDGCDNSGCTCEECGNRIHEDEGYQEVDGIILCDSCFENLASLDNIDDEYHLTRNMQFVSIAYHDQILKYDSIGICDDNFDANVLRDYFNCIHNCTIDGTNYMYVNAEECTKKGLRLFDYESLADVHESADQYYTTKVTIPPQETVPVNRLRMMVSHMTNFGNYNTNTNWVYSFAD